MSAYDRLRINFEKPIPPPADSWLKTFKSVRFARVRQDDGGPGPIIVVPDGGRAWIRPDRGRVSRAMADLYEMGDLSGARLTAAISAYVERYGMIAPPWYLLRIGRLESSPRMVTSLLFPKLRVSHDDLPLWCWVRESRELRDTIDLIVAVQHSDHAAIERWYRRWYRGRYREDPPDSAGFWRGAWATVVHRIETYLALVDVQLTYGPDGDLPFRARSRDDLIPKLPVQQLVAESLLGGIYVQLLHVISGERGLEVCDCGRPFIPKRSDQRYCTPGCGSTARGRRRRNLLRQSATG